MSQDEEGWVKYDQKGTWHHTSVTFLTDIIPEIETAILAVHGDSIYINTKYLSNEILQHPKQYPSFAGLGSKGVKQAISSCFLRVLKYPPRTRRNTHGGRIFIRNP